MPSPTSTVFAASSVSFSYGNMLALQGLSLNIERGERIALLVRFDITTPDLRNRIDTCTPMI